MSSPGSFTYWIHQLPAGDRAAIQKLWEGYFGRVIGLVRKRLAGAPRADDDEEDLVLSAFNTFFRRAQTRAAPSSNPRLRSLRGRRVFASRLFLRRLEQSGARPGVGGTRVADNYKRLLDLLPDESLRQVAVWKLEGYTNNEVAARLEWSSATVERMQHLIHLMWEKEIER
jgi:DNA-directed RNA polymerase specialized sigma24 family protein